MANYLGIDYGEKHLGLAFAAGPLAEPLQTISQATGSAVIIQLIEKYHVQKLIIGLSEGPMAVKTQQFGTKLHQLTGLPVIYHDETLSSYETRQKMAKAGKKKSRREQKIDHLVAAVILQDYLDSQAV